MIADSLDTRWAVQALDVYPMEDGPLVAVACQKESISIYKYLASDKKFEFLSSDRVSRIPTSIQFLDPHRIVGVDKHGHIFGLYNRVTRSASNVLERSMDILFHVKIGEPLVKVFTGDLRPKVLVDVPLHDFKGEDKSWFTHQSKELFWNPGCLDLGWSSSDESSGILQAVTAGASVTYPPIGRTLYGLTISGLLYGFLRIPESLYRDLLLFQELLTEEPFTKPVLGHDHSASRQCNSTIDGEFVAQFLDLGLSKKQEIVDKWNARMEERSRHGVPPASVESVTRVLSLILKCI